MSRFLAFVLALCISVPAAAASTPGSDWFRYPSISPDGSALVFSSGGDLFRVPVEGGVAVPLTLNPAWDGWPVWSPDGEWLAFASDRHGNLDVYVMPSTGGIAERLTWNSTNDVPTAFTPDGKEVLFSAVRMDDVGNSTFPTRALPELYAVDVEGGTPRMVLTTPAISARPDRSGKRLLYIDQKGYEDPMRKHHTSSVTRDLWMVDLEKGEHTNLTARPGEDRDPVWSADESAFWFLSEREGDMNVFRQDLADGTVTQLTEFEHHPVRYLSASDQDRLAFSWHGDLYTLEPGSKPEKVEIEIRVDRPEPPVTMEELGRGVSEFAVSPDGEEVAFIARGEVFVTAADFATTRRITDTPEQERSVSFSPDGRKLVYAGERDGSWNVYVTELGEGEDWFYAATDFTESEVVATDEEEFEPHFSPDGEEIAFLAERTILKVKNLDSGRVRTVLPGGFNFSYSDGDQWYSWSPDGEWFAVGFLSRGRYFSEAVGLVKSDGKSDPVDITNSGYSCIRPDWAMDGGVVVWATERYGQKNHGSWGGESDVMGTFLDRETYDRFRRDKEERAIAKGRKKPDKKGEKGEKPDDDDESDDEKEDALNKAPREIDFDRLEERTVRLTLHSSDLADWALLPEGNALVYLARFEDGYDLWAHDFVEEETKLLAKLGADRASLELVEDGDAVVVLADGQLRKIGLSSGPKGFDAGKTEPVAMRPTMQLRPDEERAYLFDHVWRQVKEKFYREDLHGVDWEFYREQYEAKLPGINNNRDFAELLSEMLGELNASHTGARWFGHRDHAESTAALGVFFDGHYDGRGMRIAEILEGGPLARADLDVEAGDLLLAIDGIALEGHVNYFAQLKDKVGERIRLSLRHQGGEEYDAVVEPIGTRDQGRLLYDRWVRQRRDLVEEVSGGRIGYVHVQGMNDRSYRTVFSDLLGRNFEKEAVIVDTRFNGGGWLHDDLIVLLGGRRYVDLKPRNQAVPGQRFYGEPGKRWWKPSAVVMSEGNYSDAHFFPWAYREVGLGPLIGMPVAGTATAVWWERLQTGDLLFGIPEVGTVDLDDGTYLENAELEPDYQVAITPEDAAAGRDPQLEKAVEVLLEQAEQEESR